MGWFVFRVNTDSDFLGGRWERKAGAAVKVSVGAGNIPWVINRNDDVYKWNGHGWDKMPGSLTDISVNHNGDVWGCNRAQEIWNWNGTWKKPSTLLTFLRFFLAESGRTSCSNFCCERRNCVVRKLQRQHLPSCWRLQRTLGKNRWCSYSRIRC